MGEAPVCPKCGETFVMVWIGHDPPEPYGEVCGCPEHLSELAEASEEKAAMDRDFRSAPTPEPQP